MEKNSRTIYIPEQNLELIYDDYTGAMDTKEDMKSIIAREKNYRNGINRGNLRSGIIRIAPDENGEMQLKVVLPFTVNLLYAKFSDNNGVNLAYMTEFGLQHKQIFFQEDGTLNFDDFEFLLTDSEKAELQESCTRR